MLEFAHLSWLFYVGLGSDIAVDVLVAIILCYFLRQSRTGFKSTDNVINVLMMYVINTGLLTAVCATCCIAIYVAMPTTFIFIGFYFCLPKLYFNSMLAMLNSRETLPRGAISLHTIRGGAGRGNAHTQHIVNISSSPNVSKDTESSTGMVNITSCSSARSDFKFGGVENQVLAVNVQTETDYHVDKVEDKSINI
ncbi:hypothetical protein EW145_g2331 [Phellinidium pouzarii]|uniref:DUF6534 domain-containing protein n=1 Tax=Phellinidium pouzarii TaxID=167371 RepID=A0A4S4LD51_9AGAM|nr:hypothetical protein EW145_g2331 [Phellinidium pouzarii]